MPVSPQDKYVAILDYEPTILTKGFNKLMVKSNGDYTLLDQMLYAGYLEGYVTAHDISNYFQNLWTEFDDQYNKTQPHFEQKFQAFKEHLMTSIEQPFLNYIADSSNLQYKVNYAIVKQLDGLYQGYRAYYGEFYQIPDYDINRYDFEDPTYVAQQDLDRLAYLPYFHFVFSNAEVDIDSVLKYSYGLVEKDFTVPNPYHNDNIMYEFNEFTRCSAMVKITHDFSDLIVSHATWQSFFEIFKTIKFYNFHYLNEYNLIFADSYPGVVGSYNDYYVNFNQRMVITETSNDLYAQDILDYAKTQPKKYLNFINVTTASMIARSNKDFEKYYTSNNGFTYPNQYMSIDYKEFIPKNPIFYDTEILYIIEAIPGTWVGKNITYDKLTSGFWSSYNKPYFHEIFELSGYSNLNTENYTSNSWSMDSRAVLFRYWQSRVSTYTDMLSVFRMNDPKGKYQKGNSKVAIMSRYDQVDTVSEQLPYGGTDTKVVDYDAILNKYVYVQASPAFNNLPPFKWSEFEERTGKTYKHKGHPDTYNFPCYKETYTQVGELVIKKMDPITMGGVIDSLGNQLNQKYDNVLYKE